MASSVIVFPLTPNYASLPRPVKQCNSCSGSFRIANYRPPNFHRIRGSSLSLSYSPSDDDNGQGTVQELRVPELWLHPPKAAEESEWLRGTLHKWLDDEYCPEETNVDISNVAARSYYKSLVEKQTDVGEILLKMARDLESISYQESFHGAFSSANAAINLIIQRIEQVQESSES